MEDVNYLMIMTLAPRPTEALGLIMLIPVTPPFTHHQPENCAQAEHVPCNSPSSSDL